MKLAILLIITTFVYCFCLIFFDEKKNNKIIKKLLFSFFIALIMNTLLILILKRSFNIFHYIAYNSFFIKFLILQIIIGIILGSSISIIYYKKYKFVKDTKIKKIKYFPTNIILFILITLVLALLYFINSYANVPPEQLAFHLQVPITGTASSLIIDFLLKTVLISAIIVFICYLQYKIFFNKKQKLLINIKNYQVKILPFNYTIKWIKVFVALVFVSIIIFAIKTYDFVELATNQFQKSEFIEKEYVNPDKVKYEFPKKKKNLVFIYLESMESSYTMYTPNLNKLAEENTNFSATDKIGGFNEIIGTNWTIASMVAQTSGLPLKFSVDSSGYNGDRKEFLKGVPTLGEILKDNGYKNYLYIGSESEFAARDVYFDTHGDYEILDYNAALKKKMIPKNYKVWWGFEDKKLYEFSKTKLLKLAKKDEPFNFTLLTVDSHPSDGWLDPSCPEKFDTKYGNVIYCADKLVNEFISWIKKQDFYEDTTVIVVGDHLYMEANDFMKTIENNDRYVYDVILNSSVKTKNTKNREFSALDMFPTTLASLGVKMDSDKLGLGVNLYSDEKTVLEKYGKKYVNEELKKKSTFYENIDLYK